MSALTRLPVGQQGAADLARDGAAIRVNSRFRSAYRDLGLGRLQAADVLRLLRQVLVDVLLAGRSLSASLR